MTTTPDPKTVREIAQEVANLALHDAVHVDQWISAVVNGRFGNECSSFRAPLHAAVARRMAVVKPSWPDEQPQDDGDVRAVRALTNAASRMLGMWAEADEAVRRELWTTLHGRADDVFDRYRERYAELDAKAGES